VRLLLHSWDLLALAFSALLASLALLRGIAGLLTAPGVFHRLEAGALALVGLGGWGGVLLARHALAATGAALGTILLC
jgi:hypothetical protein